MFELEQRMEEGLKKMGMRIPIFKNEGLRAEH
jgi:hypothetical protein